MTVSLYSKHAGTEQLLTLYFQVLIGWKVHKEGPVYKDLVYFTVCLNNFHREGPRESQMAENIFKDVLMGNNLFFCHKAMVR